jgi:hypothetical protein
MKNHEIESWVLKIIDTVISGQPVEDSRIELKSGQIPPEKAARRIAGHANAARGDQILWIIGVDEKEREVVGVLDDEDFSRWYRSIEVQFDGLAPSFTHLNIPVDGKIVIALLFDTDRAPYVVKNPAFGKSVDAVALEVPWREGTSIRSARRSELIRILSPLQKLPILKFLEGYLSASVPKVQPDEIWWNLHLNFYVELPNNERVVIPFHKCELTCKFNIEGGEIDFSDIHLSPPGMWSTSGFTSESSTIESTQHEVLIYGPGRLIVSARTVTQNLRVDEGEDALFELVLVPANSDVPISLNVLLNFVEPKKDEIYRWEGHPFIRES